MLETPTFMSPTILSVPHFLLMISCLWLSAGMHVKCGSGAYDRTTTKPTIKVHVHLDMEKLSSKFQKNTNFGICKSVSGRL